ncbi:MAG TPA: DEAD/DEAH box helicase [Chthonomonadaceae bacterium]|nr:DEAD/DEAH box helicase [Chthonomonadaceae bacterium]
MSEPETQTTVKKRSTKTKKAAETPPETSETTQATAAGDGAGRAAQQPAAPAAAGHAADPAPAAPIGDAATPAPPASRARKTVKASAEPAETVAPPPAAESDPPPAPEAEPPADDPAAEVLPAAGFRRLQLSEPSMRAIVEAGFEAPTPIQEQAIPFLLLGSDLIGQAQTGTGKTAAFALPLAERLDVSEHHTQAIVLLPTRELCIQVAQETYNLTKYHRLRVVPIYGGQPIDRQLRALSMGAHVVVGTPGRVLDHLRRGTLNLARVRVVILDEADEMLNMGFLEDVEEILKAAPETRQTALFSATMPPRIAALARDYLRDPQRVSIESKRRTVAQVSQTYYEVLPSQKVEALSRILDHETPGSTIIFCRTRREVDELGESLQMRGYEAETLHGEMNQAARDRVMSRFRAGQADLLIATDVAARGLDIDQVTHVVNYDIPWDVESYIHRIGRTGRAGRSGEAITLVSPRERYQLRQIERMINAPIRPARVPSTADIASRRREMFKARILETLADGAYDNHLMTVEELAESGDYDVSQVAAAALQLLWQAQKGAGDYDVSEANVETERAEAGMTRLYLQIGRQDGIRPGDIVGAIANEAGVPGNAIGAIDIMDRSTFVEVPEADAARVIEALSRTKLRGKRVFVEVARPRREEPFDEFRGRRDDGPYAAPRGQGGPYRGRPDGDRPWRPGPPPGRPPRRF